MKDFVEEEKEEISGSDGVECEIPSMDTNIEIRQEMKTKLVETMDNMLRNDVC